MSSNFSSSFALLNSVGRLLFLTLLNFLGETYPESKLALLLAKLESEGTGSCRIESGMINLSFADSEDDESDPTESKDSEGVEGGLVCSVDSSNLCIL